MDAEFTIINKSGVHARPAAMMAKLGRQFKSHITYTAKGMTVDGKNIIPITSVGMRYGTKVIVHAEGEDEKEAIEAILKLANGRFGEHQ